MTVVNNVKRRFRRCCVIMTIFAMCFLVGCGGSKLITRAYSLGQYPKTTEKIVKEIAIGEVVKHRIRPQGGREAIIIGPMTDENCIVVKTTLEGHRQIEASLKHLEGQLTTPRED